MARWLEIAAHYDCNNRCVGCFAVSATGQSMSPAEILDTLRYGRSQGAQDLWLGGGEPTLRRDLFATVVAARKLGYERIKLQTNGMLLAYPEFVRRCVDAGVTEVNFSIKGASAETHDRLTRTPGCFELMMKGITESADAGLSCEGDILVYRSNVREVPGMVQHFRAHGVRRFNLWAFSATTQSPEAVTEAPPRMTEIVDAIHQILASNPSERADFITSLHTPLCTLSGAAARCVFSAKTLDLIVANPGGHRFRLEDSPMEGGSYAPGCASCRARTACSGFRADYAERYGVTEFVPLSPER